MLLEGEGVDRAHQAQLALELGPAAGGAGSRRQRRTCRPAYGFGLALEVPADGLHDRLQAQATFRLVQLGPVDALARFAQLPFGGRPLVPQLLQALGAGLDSVGLGPASDAQAAEDLVELASGGPSPGP